MKPLDWPKSLPPVSRETLERLRLYHALLLKWQDKINLISPGTVADSWERHFVDSAQIAPLLPARAKTLYDLGSGAGFPGLVLAIMLPDLDVTLVESDSKKCAFLQTVSRETGVPVVIRQERIEKAAQEMPPPELITARALASLSALLNLSAPWLEGGKPLLIFPKGRRYLEEVEEARLSGWDMKIEERASMTEDGASILLLSDVAKSAA